MLRELLRRLGLAKKEPVQTPVADEVVEPQAVPSELDMLIESMTAAVRALNLRKEKAYPLLYLDRSGSTRQYPNRLWDDGTMQLLTSLVASVAKGGFSVTRNNAVPLRFFHDCVVRPSWPLDAQIRPGNAREILGRNGHLEFGGTDFAPVLMDMVRHALLIDAQAQLQDDALYEQETIIEGMSDDDLLRFIKPQIVNGKEQLRPLLQLPHPICAFMVTDGECSESLECLLEVVRWMSQLGIYIMLIGVGHHDFAVLKSMDAAGEELFLKKGLKPLWDNVDFIDFKKFTAGDANRLPDGPTVVSELIGKFMDKAYPSCREHQLIA